MVNTDDTFSGSDLKKIADWDEDSPPSNEAIKLIRCGTAFLMDGWRNRFDSPLRPIKVGGTNEKCHVQFEVEYNSELLEGELHVALNNEPPSTHLLSARLEKKKWVYSKLEASAPGRDKGAYTSGEPAKQMNYLLEELKRQATRLTARD